MNEDQYYHEGKAAYFTCAQWENPYAYGSYAAASWDAGYEAEQAEHYG